MPQVIRKRKKEDTNRHVATPAVMTLLLTRGRYLAFRLVTFRFSELFILQNHQHILSLYDMHLSPLEVMRVF